MTLVAEHIEGDTRDRILEVAERLFRQIGYQKTTVGDIAKELRMSPANVYRFFESKKAIHQAVARSLMGEVELEAQRIVAKPGPVKERFRELLTTIHRMNTERYVGDNKLHEMVEIAMQEDWQVCVNHMECVAGVVGQMIAQGVASGEFEAPAAAGCDVFLHCDGALLPPPDDRPMCHQAWPDHRPDDRFRHRGSVATPLTRRWVSLYKQPAAPG